MEGSVTILSLVAYLPKKVIPPKNLQSVILVSQNNKTAAMLVSQTNPVGVKISFFPVKFA